MAGLAILLGLALTPGWREKAAMEELEPAWVEYHFDDEFDPQTGSKTSVSSRFPKWFRSLIGEHHFRRVRFVRMKFADLDDEKLSHIAQFRSLRFLANDAIAEGSTLSPADAGGIGSHRITDDGLAHLAELRELESLMLWDTAITDAGLTHLLHLSNLTELKITSPLITDGSVDTLARMQQLEVLYVSGMCISNKGVRELRKRLPHCLIVEREWFDPGPEDEETAISHFGESGTEELRQWSRWRDGSAARMPPLLVRPFGGANGDAVHSSAKFFRTFSPLAWLFSGWNWVA